MRTPNAPASAALLAALLAAALSAGLAACEALPQASAAIGPAAAPAPSLPPGLELRSHPSGLRLGVLRSPRAPGRGALALVVASGSAAEAPGREGWTHLVEHLGFEDADGVPAEVFRAELRRRGLGLEFSGAPNAWTSSTHVLYLFPFEAFGPRDLEGALELALGILLAEELEPGALERARAVVLRELAEYASGEPEEEPSDREEILGAGSGAPVDGILGSRASLLAAEPGALAAFRAALHRPDSASLVAVGDLDEASALAALRRAVDRAFAERDASRGAGRVAGSVAGAGAGAAAPFAGPAGPPPAATEAGREPLDREAPAAGLEHDESGLTRLSLSFPLAAPWPRSARDAAREGLAASLFQARLARRLGLHRANRRPLAAGLGEGGLELELVAEPSGLVALLRAAGGELRAALADLRPGELAAAALAYEAGLREEVARRGDLLPEDLAVRVGDAIGGAGSAWAAFEPERLLEELRDPESLAPLGLLRDALRLGELGFEGASGDPRLDSRLQAARERRSEPGALARGGLFEAPPLPPLPRRALPTATRAEARRGGTGAPVARLVEYAGGVRAVLFPARPGEAGVELYAVSSSGAGWEPKAEGDSPEPGDPPALDTGVHDLPVPGLARAFAAAGVELELATREGCEELSAWAPRDAEEELFALLGSLLGGSGGGSRYPSRESRPRRGWDDRGGGPADFLWLVAGLPDLDRAEALLGRAFAADPEPPLAASEADPSAGPAPERDAGGTGEPAAGAAGQGGASRREVRLRAELRLGAAEDYADGRALAALSRLVHAELLRVLRDEALGLYSLEAELSAPPGIAAGGLLSVEFACAAEDAARLESLARAVLRRLLAGEADAALLEDAARGVDLELRLLPDLFAPWIAALGPEVRRAETARRSGAEKSDAEGGRGLGSSAAAEAFREAISALGFDSEPRAPEPPAESLRRALALIQSVDPVFRRVEP